MSAKSTTSGNGGDYERHGRFEWLRSEVTIGVVLLVTVLPALMQGFSSLKLLPIG